MRGSVYSTLVHCTRTEIATTLRQSNTEDTVTRDTCSERVDCRRVANTYTSAHKGLVRFANTIFCFLNVSLIVVRMLSSFPCLYFSAPLFLFLCSLSPLFILHRLLQPCFSSAQKVYARISRATLEFTGVVAQTQCMFASPYGLV